MRPEQSKIMLELLVGIRGRRMLMEMQDDTRMFLLLQKLKDCKEARDKPMVRDENLTRFCNQHAAFSILDASSPQGYKLACFEANAPSQKAMSAINAFKKKYKKGAANNQKGELSRVEELLEWHMLFDENEKGKRKATRDLDDKQKAEIHELGLHLGMVDNPAQESVFTGSAFMCVYYPLPTRFTDNVPN